MSYSVVKLMEVSKNDVNFVRKILTMFVNEINDKLLLIQKALQENNCQEIASIAHQFKSNFQLLNCDDLVLLSKEIEECTNIEDDCEACEKKTIELINSINVLKDQIKLDLDNGKY